MVGATHFLISILVVVGECKPREKVNKMKRAEKKQDSCVQITDGMELPDHCQEYCVAIRSEFSQIFIQSWSPAMYRECLPTVHKSECESDQLLQPGRSWQI